MHFIANLCTSLCPSPRVFLATTPEISRMGFDRAWNRVFPHSSDNYSTLYQEQSTIHEILGLRIESDEIRSYRRTALRWEGMWVVEWILFLSPACWTQILWSCCRICRKRQRRERTRTFPRVLLYPAKRKYSYITMRELKVRNYTTSIKFASEQTSLKSKLVFPDNLWNPPI